jgi:hypothetical protein
MWAFCWSWFNPSCRSETTCVLLKWANQCTFNAILWFSINFCFCTITRISYLFISYSLKDYFLFRFNDNFLFLEFNNILSLIFLFFLNLLHCLNYCKLRWQSQLFNNPFCFRSITTWSLLVRILFSNPLDLLIISSDWIKTLPVNFQLIPNLNLLFELISFNCKHIRSISLALKLINFFKYLSYFPIEFS